MNKWGGAIYKPKWKISCDGKKTKKKVLQNKLVKRKLKKGIYKAT